MMTAENVHFVCPSQSHDCRMRRERLIRPTDGAEFVGLIRRVSVASGICARLPDAVNALSGLRMAGICRPDKTR
ncbi:hypothetical protein ACN59_30760 [Escherichia coli]|nr:hypothetical protein ACN59_30760 [Escherichia coli]